jgi:predicted permease
MGWLRRLHGTLGGSTAADRLDDEMRLHLEERTREYVERGLSPEQARDLALKRFGSVTLVKERARDADTLRWLADIGQDLRYALRQLRKTPAFAFVVVLSLALGIGASTAIFSLLDALVLRTLPVATPERLVRIGSASAGDRSSTWSYRIWDQIRQHAPMFDGTIACSSIERFNLADGAGETQPADGILVSGEFFSMLGVRAVAGRMLTAADDVRGGSSGPAAVISYALWQRRFGGIPNIVGTPLIVERVPFTIVGVAPPAFFGIEVGRAFDVAIPITAESLIHGKDSRLDETGGWSFLTILARLKSGQSQEEATAALRGVQPQIRAAAMPRHLPPALQRDFLNQPFSLAPSAAGMSPLRRTYGRPLVILSAIVALVLFIACANIANLLLARTIARRHELSVRVSLGASRWRIARQQLVESVLLASAGAGAGLLIAAWGSRALAALVSTTGRPVVLDLSLNWRIMGFTAVVTLATLIVFATAPALRATRSEPIDALKQRDRDGSRSVPLSSGLVVAQVALSLVLVVAAGLFVRTFERLATMPLGFDGDRVLVASVNLYRTAIDPAGRLSLYDRLVERVAAVPGVELAAASIVTPIGGNTLIDVVNLPGVAPATQPFEGGRLSARATMVNYVTPEWFAAYGMKMRAGRDFTDRDVASDAPVVVVNETFARRFLSDRNPIGATFAGMAPPGTVPAQKTVIGVVADAVYGSLRDDPAPAMFAPLRQARVGAPLQMSISIRSAAGSPTAVAHDVASALTSVDRDLTFSFRAVADQVSMSIHQERLIALLSGFFGLLALLIAGIGLYGVTSYAVGRRRGEMSIRMALGARPTTIIGLVLSRVCRLVAVGVAIGAVLSLWAARFVSSLLFGVEPHDMPTFVGAVVVLASVGAIAAWLPARRASRIDPAEVLREI